MYYSKYSATQLAAFAATVRKTKSTETWCIFDNTARHAAWDDALQFVAALTEIDSNPRDLAAAREREGHIGEA
jgi:uncharacterized protein YecE (DUF72 family)